MTWIFVDSAITIEGPFSKEENNKTTFIFSARKSYLEISHVKENSFFVDEQRFGPYKFWHHKHKFEIIDGGIKIIDILDYSLPLGFIGLFFHPFLVKPKLDEIFRYREKKLIEIFGKL